MLRGEQPTILGDGEQSRDFTYIDNAVHANLLACQAPAGQAVGQAFNIAIGRSVTLNETYQLLRGLTQNTRPPVYGPERGGDIKHSLADISKAEMGLGYKPAVGFEEGLQPTVEWYRQSGGQHRYAAPAAS